MGIGSNELLQDLVERTLLHIYQAEKMKALPIEVLIQRITPADWNILECLEHLNLYGDFYIPEIKNSIKNSNRQPQEKFKSGILGNYFSKMMLPKKKLNKMKTFQNKNPINNNLNHSSIDRFILQQYQLLELLKKSKKIDLNKTKTSISISTWIKLKLGDTFKLVIYHNERHILQANKILDKIN